MKIQIPSKTFLWGEYSALSRGCAAVVATKPYFEFEDKQDEKFELHPQSPASLYADKNDLKGLKAQFDDPHLGSGGFGCSTAEFLAIYIFLQEKKIKIHTEDQGTYTQSKTLDPRLMLKDYLSLHKNFKIKPSGYDLIAQALGGIVVFDNHLKFKSFHWPFIEKAFLIFKTNLKVKTHDHLSSLNKKNFDHFSSFSEKINLAFYLKNYLSFIKNLKAFDSELESKHLKSLEALSSTHEIMSIDGVDYSRGCGALGADVILIFCDSLKKDQVKQAIAEQEHLNLKFIADNSDIV